MLAAVATTWAQASAAGAATWAPGAPPPAHSMHTVRQAYEFNGFVMAGADFPLRLVFVGDPPEGVRATQVEYAARAAAQEWSRVSCSSARVEYAGRRASVGDLQPGERPFVFASPGTPRCFPPGSIGWTALTCGAGFPDKSIFLNRDDYDWSAQPVPFQFAGAAQTPAPRLIVDVQSALTHEIGHVLGLGHSEDALATMTPRYLPDGGQSSLAVDDKLGLCTLYPAASPTDECRRGRDCRPQEGCARVDFLGRTLRLCQELRAQPGEVCAPDRLVCEDACVFHPNPHDFGYCTNACDPAVGDGTDGPGGCPDGFVCTPGLIAQDAAHCQRRAGFDGLNPTGCSTQNTTPGTLPWWAWASGVGWLVHRRRLHKRARRH